MKKIPVGKTVAQVSKQKVEMQTAQKGLSSTAGQRVLGDMIKALEIVQADLESKSYADPHRETIFAAQARLRDNSTPSHQRAVYSEIIQLMSQGAGQ